ncbi:MAG: bacillithiol system redox-active protein YtxJ [Acidobacteria bacterium]|nr:bacillithiol system redox-active protein YtxJ [Acidobacteriota bacterium]MBK7934283.1 bacillithiol system redox-active protein YtxJ [Acidobacteriota bacterium]
MTATFVKIQSLEQLDALFESSFTGPVALLKHSNSCGISSHVLEMAAEAEGTIHVVVIQENRDISDEIATRTGYRHQSPQAFVIKDGKTIYHATHYGIDPVKIEESLNS